MERPFASGRPVGPLVDFQGPIFGDGSSNITNLREPSEDDRDIIMSHLEASKEDDICLIAHAFARELLITSSDGIVEQMTPVTDTGSGLFGKNIAKSMNTLTDRVSPGQFIAIHTTTEDNEEEIVKNGLKSRADMGLDPLNGSRLRNQSVFAHGDAKSFITHTMSRTRGEDNVYVPLICDMDKCKWSNPMIAQGLVDGTVTPEEYRQYGVIDYTRLLECTADGEFEERYKAFYPYNTKMSIESVPSDNFDEYESMTRSYAREMSTL